MSDTFVDPPFDEFWALYPRKRGKFQARKAFGAALLVAPQETIMAGLKRYIATLDLDFIKYPAGWLRDRRWEDEG
jgi:hypothetical protein